MSVNDYNEQLYDVMQALLEEGELEKTTPAHGIIQQVIHNGHESLTPRQRTLYDAIITPALKRRGEELNATQY
jgi:hypothetical protein